MGSDVGSSRPTSSSTIFPPGDGDGYDFVHARVAAVGKGSKVVSSSPDFFDVASPDPPQRKSSNRGADARAQACTDDKGRKGGQGTPPCEGLPSLQPYEESILRPFRSGCFDMWRVMVYLYRFRDNETITDYLCKILTTVPLEDLEFYISQLLHLLLQSSPGSPLEKLVMDQCASSMHFAFHVFWHMQAAAADNTEWSSRAQTLQQACETAIINARRPTLIHEEAEKNLKRSKSSPNLQGKGFSVEGEEDQDSVPEMTDFSLEEGSDAPAAGLRNSVSDLPPRQNKPAKGSGNVHWDLGRHEVEGGSSIPPSELAAEPSDSDEIQQFMIKDARCRYFNAVLDLNSTLSEISDRLRHVTDRDERNNLLREQLTMVNQTLQEVGVYLPLYPVNEPHYRILRLPRYDCFCLNSRERCPFLFHMEVMESTFDCSVRDLTTGSEPHPLPMSPAVKPREGGESPPDVDSLSGSQSQLSAAQTDTEEHHVGDTPQTEDASSSAYGEVWRDKERRIARSSPFGYMPEWNLKCVIVKTGDDCRQEALAMQLISQIHNIWKDAGVPLWLRPYRVLVTGASTGLIETVPDAVSLDSLKKKTPNFTTLAEYFQTYYGGPHSRSYQIAQRNFVESMAAYSIVCYLLQVKDRHNGNILMDTQGHVIHIDFGFLLSNSPGAICWEDVPFKLTQEYLEVMGGEGAEAFNTFKLLCIRGFLELRRHYERLVILVDMMEKDSPLPCFASNERVSLAMMERFKLGLSEQECVEHVVALVDESINNWRSTSYDSFQRFTNGIL